MMKFSERRARDKAAAAEVAREATRQHLIAAVEGIAAAALQILDLYESGAVTPEQNAEFGVAINQMKVDLQPFIEPLDRTREILGILDETRAAYAP